MTNLETLQQELDKISDGEYVCFENDDKSTTYLDGRFSFAQLKSIINAIERHASTTGESQPPES